MFRRRKTFSNLKVFRVSFSSIFKQSDGVVCQGTGAGVLGDQESTGNYCRTRSAPGPGNSFTH